MFTYIYIIRFNKNIMGTLDMLPGSPCRKDLRKLFFFFQPFLEMVLHNWQLHTFSLKMYIYIHWLKNIEKDVVSKEQRIDKGCIEQ